MSQFTRVREFILMMKALARLLYIASLPHLVGAADFTREQAEFFEKRVRPLLAENCYRCHSQEAKSLKGGLRLDSRRGVLNGGESGPSIIPGKPAQSRLYQAVSYQHGKLKMPPRTQLADKDIRILETWIRMGAPDPRTDEGSELITHDIDIEKGRQFWAFQPVQKPNIPKGKRGWARTDIDRLVQARHLEKGLKPVGSAAAATLLRRLSFDLTGLPPTLEQTEDYLAQHTRNPRAATEKLVDRMLASPHFGERWGRYWLDVARYSESTGMERNCTFTQAWRYRDYVIQAFNQDKPFDQFIREQLAGDLLPAANEDEAMSNLVATGFLALGPKSLNERDRAQFRADVVDEQIDTTTRAFMGLTVSCARCHDHKFDPVPTRDYYAIYGIFHSSQTYFGTDGTGNRQKSNLLPLGGEDDGFAQAVEAHKNRLQKAQKRNKAVTVRSQEIQKQLKKKSPEREALLKEQAELRKEKKQLSTRLKQLNKEKPRPGNLAMGIGDAKAVADARIHLRGDVHNLGKPVPRGYLSVINVPGASHVNTEQSGRLELANWIASPENPLTARVLANRLWKHLFGEGIVRTVDNFGKTGQHPDDPVLLDHLATRIIENKWSVKKTLREIVLSQTYQLASEPNAENFLQDPENRFWWRSHHRRLDAEAIRDAILASSGGLDLKPENGSSVTRLGEINIGRDAAKLAGLNKSNPHRSVYHPIIRNGLPDVLKLFDFAEPSIIVGNRQVTTVPSQALYLMNSPFLLEHSEQLAHRITEAGMVTPAEQIRHAYRITLSREPTPRELPRMQDYLAQSGGNLANLCQVLLSSAEFRFIE